MSVRLLAGPFPQTVNQQIVNTIVGAKLLMWWPGVGLVSTDGPEGGRYSSRTGVMSMDGRFCDRSNTVLGSAGWWPTKQVLVKHRTGNWGADGAQVTVEFQYDPILFVPQTVGPERDGPVNHVLKGKGYCKLVDRSIYYANGHIRVVIDHEDVGVEGPSGPFVGADLHPGRSDTEVFVAERGVGATGFRNSRGVFYDTVIKNWSSPVYDIGMDCEQLVYATDFGVLVSNHTVNSGGTG